MKKLSLFMSVSLFLILMSLPALCHEYWIDAEKFFASKNEKIKIFICSGHNFPLSSFALSESVLGGVEVITPGGKKVSLETREEKNGKRRTAEVSLGETGTYLLTFHLQRPRMKKPIYYAKAIILCGEGDETEPLRVDTNPLEIVPGKNIAKLKAGDDLPLKLLVEGKPTRTTFHISINGKKNFYLRSRAHGVATLRLADKGKYLITASYEGIGCSLVFCVE